MMSQSSILLIHLEDVIGLLLVFKGKATIKR